VIFFAVPIESFDKQVIKEHKKYFQNRDHLLIDVLSVRNPAKIFKTITLKKYKNTKRF